MRPRSSSRGRNTSALVTVSYNYSAIQHIDIEMVYWYLRHIEVCGPAAADSLSEIVCCSCCVIQIIGSSLLIVSDNVRVGAWMIDFAKTLYVPDRLITHRDPWQLGNHEDGYLIGIDNLIKVRSWQFR